MRAKGRRNGAIAAIVQDERAYALGGELLRPPFWRPNLRESQSNLRYSSLAADFSGILRKRPPGGL